MRMIRDATGRFTERPHYDTSEIELDCERLVTEFLSDKYGRVQWPITTDDLTVLLEQHVDKLDLYADLSDEGEDVEGVTDFPPGARPRVRISRELSSTGNDNRLRTTLTHELGHVRFHGFLFELKASALDLFGTSDVTTPASVSSPAGPQKCRRQNILHAGPVDWLEWQAGYACGALLMPASHLRRVVSDYCHRQSIIRELDVTAPEAADIIETVANAFAVSTEAARVRLLKTHHLREAQQSEALFD